MKTYNQHYKDCKFNKISNSVYDLTIEKNFIDLDVSLLAKQVNHKFDNFIDCFETNWSINLNNWRDIVELKTLCNVVMPKIEEKIFDSYLKIEHIHIYKNKPSAYEDSSWVWHYDDCPKEFIKFAVYLNNTDESSGCMQYISGKQSVPVVDTYRLDPTAIKGFPPPVYPKTRIPKIVVENIISNGGRINNLVGPAGFNFVFTPNIMHRGTIATSQSIPRQAIFMFLRPSLEKREYLDETVHSFLPSQNVKKYNLN